MKRLYSFIIVFVCFILAQTAIMAQEFVIDNSSADTFCGGGAYDGNNFLYTIIGDASNLYSITAQLISKDGSLVGSRISLGATGSGSMAAFDGTNYLVVWTDEFPRMASGDTNGIGNLYGQFISTAGTLVGSKFNIVNDINIKFGQGRGSLSFEEGNYFLTYLKGNDHHTDYIYGQLIAKSGELSGSPVKISEAYAREECIAFDGSNYLIAWCKCDYPNTDSQIYGQFVNSVGTLVGQNFLIDGSENASDNPLTIAWDGERYLVCFHDQAVDTTGRWNLIGRFVWAVGLPDERFVICDSSKNPFYATPAYDGENYLITWMQSNGKMSMKGRHFTTGGVAIDTPFVVFDTLNGKFPIGGVSGFVNDKYVIGATMLDNNFKNGDIYGLFLSPKTTAVNSKDNAVIKSFTLSQNYPNPFNPATVINYSVPKESHVTIKVFDILGREVASLVNEVKQSGSYSVKFDGSKLTSGIYLYKMQAGNFAVTKKLVLMK
ncbi:MAG: T9SS type A sorting domain-containing protein [Ignavibacteriaceae bacterium]|nr:T9SS type A sorting domain-containing protein [Ignavibacteriaceae bacterium]